MNDLGRITPRTAEPLALDHYADVRRTGAFLLVDPVDGSTPTAGTLPSGRSSPRPQVPSESRGLGASMRPVCGRRLPAR
ncbi:hypothetical protein ACWDBO_11525 [Streptomyces mirabilis]|uniref:hypothetical protein n=1 Tax=Streptomyces TaxID=1883 RepID=UPI0039F4F45A